MNGFCSFRQCTMDGPRTEKELKDEKKKPSFVKKGALLFFLVYLIRFEGYLSRKKKKKEKVSPKKERLFYFHPSIQLHWYVEYICVKMQTATCFLGEKQGRIMFGKYI